MAAYCSQPVVLRLTLGANVVDLMDAAQGFRVEELDLGYPTVREDTGLLPARNGVDDRTRLFGERAVRISGALVPSAAGSRSKAWHALAPFLDPAARSTLTFQVDADTSPRSITVRVAQVSGPYDHPLISKVSLGFKASDPYAYDTSSRAVVVYVTGVGSGRAYNLTFPRVYPAGGQAFATLYNFGEAPAFPVLRFYGPITGPSAIVGRSVGGVVTNTTVGFVSSYIISAGHYVEVDTGRRTAFLDGDPTQSQYTYLLADLTAGWPSIPPGATADYATLLLRGSGYSSATQLIATWADPYLM